MKVSLIVPAYNEEKYIGKLLRSIRCQTRLPDEIIICDNGSSDNTVKIIKQFQPKMPIKVVSETKKGIIPAVEKAWRSSTGDIILKTDADCLLPQDWVKNYLNHYRQDPNLVACGGGFSAADGNLVLRFLTPLGCYFNHLFLHLSKGHTVLFGGNFSVKRKTMVEINGYQNNTGQYLQDDVLISQKLYQSNSNYKYFFDLNNSTSVRRFNSLKNTCLNFFSSLVPSLYQEKSS
jgi:glycosyltransferase involved in cell wall biosynthesis